MKKQAISLSLILALVSIVAVSAQNQDKENFFRGGASDIKSNDRNRARKAIQKWTAKDGRQGEQLLSEAPFYWDRTKVGRPVFIRIIKNSNLKGILEVWSEKPGSREFELLKKYKIALFSGTLGPKTREGDFQAPEGFYYINRGRLNPNSSYHLSMDIGYPNTYDRALKRTGSLIMIHGSVLSIGCFAMTDCSIEQIYTLVERALSKGQKFVRVHSFPFVMTEENLEKHKDNPNYEFWKNLKAGWDWFEKHKRPPDVNVIDGRYSFSAG